MSNTIFALAGYISWTIILLVMLAGYRTYLAKSGKAPSLKFKSDGSDVDELGQRITRAQANCSESFVFIGGTMLLALATNSAVISDSLAMYVLLARIGQSLIHLVSTSTLAIQLRFVFFLVQVGICAYWLIQILIKFSS